MLFKRCIYYMPKQTQKAYWEMQWAERDVERLIASGPTKAWWPVLCELLESLDRQALILEAGCGLGQFVYLLHKQGWRVLGVDLADEALRRTKQRYPQLDLQVQDVTKLHLPDACVGMYLSLGVVEHSPEGPDAILNEAARVVADNGILFITVPYMNLYRRLREPWWRAKHSLRRWRIWSRWEEIEFYQYAFNRSEFSAILQRHGFIPQRVMLHHTHVALQKDLGAMSWFRRRYAKKKDPDKLDTKRIRELAEKLDRISPSLMAHMMLVVACRRVREHRSTADHEHTARYRTLHSPSRGGHVESR